MQASKHRAGTAVTLAVMWAQGCLSAEALAIVRHTRPAPIPVK